MKIYYRFLGLLLVFVVLLGLTSVGNAQSAPPTIDISTGTIILMVFSAISLSALSVMAPKIGILVFPLLAIVCLAMVYIPELKGVVSKEILYAVPAPFFIGSLIWFTLSCVGYRKNKRLSG